VPGNELFHMLFSDLKLIKVINSSIRKPWLLYFVFEATVVALEAFASGVDCIH